MGVPVCQLAFRKLMTLGSQRFYRLRNCAVTGQPVPTDGRSLAQKGAYQGKRSGGRALICEFLEELYQSMSEPMPEATGGASSGPRCMNFRRHRGRRPKLSSLQFKVKSESHQQPGSKRLRHLPPGTFTDYLMLFREKHPDTKVSLKLFNTVPCTLFNKLVGVVGP